VFNKFLFNQGISLYSCLHTTWTISVKVIYLFLHLFFYLFFLSLLGRRQTKKKRFPRAWRLALLYSSSSLGDGPGRTAVPSRSPVPSRLGRFGSGSSPSSCRAGDDGRRCSGSTSRMRLNNSRALSQFSHKMASSS